MIRALVTGELRADPQQRTGKNGKPFALARLSVPMGDEGRVSCSLIAFEADASPASSAVVADAAMVAAEAVVRISRRPDGKGLLARMKKVKLIEGKKPSAALHGDEMRITVTPAQGMAGRPSSDRIMQATGIR